MSGQIASIEPGHLELLNHTLGLTEWNRTPNRNYFMTGENSSDFPRLTALVDAGMMTMRPNAEWLGGGFYFAATDYGRKYAIEMLPPPKKKTRYDQYLSSECVESFPEWLGIDIPEREYNWDCWGEQKNKVRFKSRRGTGEWCKTIKEAKVSYKAAIKRNKEVEKERLKAWGIGVTSA
ncbi:hypothetical protein [Undibacterium crateris]|uniref:hypothetical protein n=1 Tax=Undibacterium crateris TaxID=2528175 RepID=UPI0013898617|nr:hypothetical protein [Undibacterium crateris]NDI85100.1 hypothetical protein [Undibacterium crateris]